MHMVFPIIRSSFPVLVTVALWVTTVKVWFPHRFFIAKLLLRAKFDFEGKSSVKNGQSTRKETGDIISFICDSFSKTNRRNKRHNHNQNQFDWILFFLYLKTLYVHFKARLTFHSIVYSINNSLTSGITF